MSEDLRSALARWYRDVRPERRFYEPPAITDESTLEGYELVKLFRRMTRRPPGAEPTFAELRLSNTVLDALGEIALRLTPNIPQA